MDARTRDYIIGRSSTVHPHPSPAPVNGTTLAYALRGKSKVQRAVLGTRLVGRDFRKPTHRQLAAMCGVSESYFNRALSLSPEGRSAALETGVLPPTAADVLRTVTRAGVEPTWTILTSPDV